MNWHRYRRITSAIFIIALVISGIFLVLAIHYYAGGKPGDRSAEGFSIIDNYFCDLGRTRGFNRLPNTTSMILFSISTSLAGIAMVPFIIGFQSLIPKDKAKKLKWLATALGVIAGISYIGVGNSPYNEYQLFHKIVIYTALASSGATCFFFFFAMKHSTLPRGLRFLFLLPVVFVVEYVLHIYFKLPKPNGVQKFVVLSLILCFLIHAVVIFFHKEKRPAV